MVTYMENKLLSLQWTIDLLFKSSINKRILKKKREFVVVLLLFIFSSFFQIKLIFRLDQVKRKKKPDSEENNLKQGENDGGNVRC